MTNILCLSCANVFSIAGPCPLCGVATPADRYNAVVDIARETVRFAKQYREQFEEIGAEEAETTRYYLAPPPEWLVFVGVAILSGAIGNAGYDILKAAARRIIETWAARSGQRVKETIDDAFLRTMLVQFGEYFQGLRDLPPSIRTAVLDEFFTHLMDQYREAHPEILDAMRSTQDDPVARARVIGTWRANAIRARKDSAPDMPEHFKYLWSHLQLENGEDPDRDT